MTWAERIAARNRAIVDAGQWRTLRTLDGPGPAFTLDDGRAIVSFASNDYLGLSQHPAVVRAATDALEQWGTGSGSARLIVGSRPVHRELERELAEWKHSEAALLFPTGFAANLGVITTFATAGVLVVSDELNHASIIDGCRLSRGAWRSRATATWPTSTRCSPRTTVRPSSSPTPCSRWTATRLRSTICSTCARATALVVVDEAHAVLGPDVPEYPNLLRVGTLSKTLGSLGGFVAGPRAFIDLMINAARPFIFTTAPTPADTAAALAALRVLRSDEGTALATRLRAHVERIAPGHPSPIVPIVLGDERRAMDASKRLLDDHGLLVPAIRPPTVAAGTSRLRIALSAAHTDDDVDRLAKALVEL